MAFIKSHRFSSFVLQELPVNFDGRISDDLQAKVQVPIGVDEVSLTERGVEFEALTNPCLASMISFLNPKDFRALLGVSKSIHHQLTHFLLPSI